MERTQVHKKEKNSQIGTRMAAVNMMCRKGQSIQDVADCLMESPTWVSKWVERFEKGGMDALRDLD